MSAAETSFQIRPGNQTDLTPNPCSPQDYLQLPEASPGLLHPHRAVSSARQGTKSQPGGKNQWPQELFLPWSTLKAVTAFP